MASRSRARPTRSSQAAHACNGRVRARMVELLYSWWLSALASVAVFFGRKRRALDLYQQIVELRPRNERAHSTVGNLQMELGDAQAAKRTFEALTAAAPRNATAWFNLGFICDHNNED